MTNKAVGKWMDEVIKEIRCAQYLKPEPEPKQKQNKMICYRSKGKVVYFCTGDEDNTHFVPTRNWTLYLKLRRTLPRRCRLFDSILDARVGAIDFYNKERQTA